MDDRLKRIHDAADHISSAISGRIPEFGIVLGSGLGRLADKIINQTVIPYSQIPGFPVSTAVGHKGNFIFGELGGKQVIAMQGRFHYYEGYPMDLVTIGIRVMKTLGVKYLFVSNAAGACNPDFKVGDLVIIRDHINMMPNPLVGPNLDEFGPRFPDMTCAYDLKLQALAENRANLRNPGRSPLLSFGRSRSGRHVNHSGGHSGAAFGHQGLRNVGCHQQVQLHQRGEELQ